MEDGNFLDRERVRDERTVTAPGYSFGAHDHGFLLARELDEPLERLFEFGRLHIVGVTAKRRIAPAGIRGIGAGVAQATEFTEMNVADSRAAQFRGQSAAVELRIVARPR